MNDTGVVDERHETVKRSEINSIIAKAKDFFAEQGFQLPPWAFWGPQDWKGKRDRCREIINNGLGWDITDFGRGDFAACGLVLFTLRNGNIALGDRKPYAEKIMITEESQETPMHFHWSKMEDIINRGGGNLVIELYSSTEDDKLGEDPVTVCIDAIENVVEPGGQVILHPGESICLEQRVYHRFYGEPGEGTVLIGEVSTVNDDSADNCFLEKTGRFPEIEEDADPIHLLCGDYGAYL